MHNENNEVLFLNSIWPGFFCKKILKVFYRDFKLSIIRKTKDVFFFFWKGKTKYVDHITRANHRCTMGLDSIQNFLGISAASFAAATFFTMNYHIYRYQIKDE